MDIWKPELSVNKSIRMRLQKLKWLFIKRLDGKRKWTNPFIYSTLFLWSKNSADQRHFRAQIIIWNILISNHFMNCNFSKSGYMCMIFYRRDTHIAEIQMGLPAVRLEDACTVDNFDVMKLEYVTLVGE